MPSSAYIKECMEWLRSKGVVADRNNVGFGDVGNTGRMYRYGVKDAGDIIGILRTGQHFEIECKRSTGGRLSTGQQKRMDKIKDSNGLYFVVHGVEELENCFYWTWTGREGL